MFLFSKKHVETSETATAEVVEPFQQQYDAIPSTYNKNGRPVQVQGGGDGPLSLPKGVENEISSSNLFSNLHPENSNPMPSLNPKEQRAYDTIKRLQYVMDDCIKLPCCDRRMGMDPILGFVPGLGDFASAVVSLVIVARVAPVLSRYTIVRMLSNIWIDAVTGIFPIVGDIFDIGWKANQRNVAIFEDQMKVGYEVRLNTDRRWFILVALVFVGICALTTLIVIGLSIALILFIRSIL